MDDRQPGSWHQFAILRTPYQFVKMEGLQKGLHARIRGGYCGFSYSTDNEVMASASCLCIRRVGTRKRSPVSFPLLDTRRCSTCPTLSRTNRVGVHTSLPSQKPFLSLHFGSIADDPSPNASLQERVLLYKKEHVANRGSHSSSYRLSNWLVTLFSPATSEAFASTRFFSSSDRTGPFSVT